MFSFTIRRWRDQLEEKDPFDSFATSMFDVVCCYLISMEFEEVGEIEHPCFTPMMLMIASNSLLVTYILSEGFLCAESLLMFL